MEAGLEKRKDLSKTTSLINDRVNAKAQRYGHLSLGVIPLNSTVSHVYAMKDCLRIRIPGSVLELDCLSCTELDVVMGRT